MRKTKSRRRRQNGATLLLGTIALVAVLPLVGLAVDSGILFIVKSKLQSSVDGAALAAARALTLGATTSAQAASARQNASNWFHANYPDGTMGTRNTVLETPVVMDDTVNPLVRNVTVTASTEVRHYFMGWVGIPTTTVSATGKASRRDVVVMLVLDQSNSMNGNNGCANMRMAAKLFTGQFAAGRDRIGLVAFADSLVTLRAPDTDFQTALGYTNGSGSATGLIDSITCYGGTGMPQAVSAGYQAILAKNLPGALNVIMLMTDGQPSALTVNMKQPYPGVATTVTLKSTSPCQDTQGRTLAGGGNFLTYTPNWTPGVNFSTYFPGSTFTIPAGMVTTAGNYDPPSTSTWGGTRYMGAPLTLLGSTAAPGCAVNSGYTNFTTDFSWVPDSDVYGNSFTGYKTGITRDGSGHIVASSGTSLRNAAFNATDNAANTARTGPIPAYVFCVGLGGTTGTPPDYELMQRVANDPDPDQFNTPPLYGAYTPRPNQFQGTFIFSSTPAQLSQAFLQISSMILRLSQ
jgi:Mg-chelatase subunit ChlD